MIFQHFCFIIVVIKIMGAICKNWPPVDSRTLGCPSLSSETRKRTVPPMGLSFNKLSKYIKVIVHPQMKTQSLSTHPQANWTSGLVFQSTKCCWSFTGKQSCRQSQTMEVNDDQFSNGKNNWKKKSIAHLI